MNLSYVFVPLTLIAIAGFVGGIACRVFSFTPRVLNLALHLAGSSFNLVLGITGPLTGLTLYATGCLIYLALHAILIHGTSPFLAH